MQKAVLAILLMILMFMGLISFSPGIPEIGTTESSTESPTASVTAEPTTAATAAPTEVPTAAPTEVP
ncbi:MAG TPA: hypothetical protein GXZ64_01080, partial [Clostridiaceae bacterium]|nr:hypothetical protein [Clostridiaceae bacterium]